MKNYPHFRVLMLLALASCCLETTVLGQDAKSLVEDYLETSNELKDNDLPGAIQSAKKALLAAQKENLKDYYGRIHLQLGSMYLGSNLIDSAQSSLEEAVNYLPAQGLLTAETHRALGSVYYFKDELSRAQETYLIALQIFTELDDQIRQADVLAQLGSISLLKKEFNKAIDYYDKAFLLNESLGDSTAMSNSLYSTGKAYTHLRNYSKALNYYQRSLSMNVLNRVDLASLYRDIGLSLYNLHQFEQCVSYYRRAIAEDELKGNLESNFYAFNQISLAYLKSNYFDRAKELADSSLNLALLNKDLSQITKAYQTQSIVHEGLGDLQGALRFTKQYHRSLDSLQQKEKNDQIALLSASLDDEKRERFAEQGTAQSRITELERYRDGWFQYSILMAVGLVGVILLVLYLKVKTDKSNAKMLVAKEKELQGLTGFKDRIFTVISHDLKSPLAAFNNLSKSLEGNIDSFSKHEFKEYLQNLGKSSIELKRMLTNLMEWAVNQTGSMPFRPDYFNCKHVADEAREQLLPSALDKKQNIIVFIPDQQQGYGDKGMVLLVLTNLLANAINFTPEKGIITIFGGNREDLITLGVKDTGVGISEEDQKKLFDIDEDVRAIGKLGQKGAGIGLLLCKELVEKNRGVMYVESNPGQGSSFYFSLPESAL